VHKHKKLAVLPQRLIAALQKADKGGEIATKLFASSFVTRERCWRGMFWAASKHLVHPTATNTASSMRLALCSPRTPPSAAQRVGALTSLQSGKSIR
jgi:hypothetical protein